MAPGKNTCKLQTLGVRGKLFRITPYAQGPESPHQDGPGPLKAPPRPEGFGTRNVRLLGMFLPGPPMPANAIATGEVERSVFLETLGVFLGRHNVEDPEGDPWVAA